MITSSYSVGRQPCANFEPTDDLFSGSGNEHQCAYPFNGEGKGWCATTHHGLVSFCKNCSSDHHKGGYETCSKYAPPQHQGGER